LKPTILALAGRFEKDVVAMRRALHAMPEASFKEIKTQALQDMAQLRSYEAELAAAEIRMQFYRDQADWLKQRIEEGYSEMEKLWTPSHFTRDVVPQLLAGGATKDDIDMLLVTNPRRFFAGDALPAIRGCGPRSPSVAMIPALTPSVPAWVCVAHGCRPSRTN